MIDKLKSKIKDYIDTRIKYRLLQESGEGDGKNLRLWEDLIAINLPPKKYQNLPDVSHHRQGICQIKPETLDLQKSIDAYIEEDSFPLPATEDREGYMDDRHYEFWLAGLSDYLKIKMILQQHGYELTPGFCVYDFGCASGRVIRHFFSQEKDLDLWASDINSNHVEWVIKYLAKSIKVFQNHAMPQLPIGDNFFDLIYAFSVFSHIDAFEISWLLELRRIMKPGGLAYITTHTNNTWSLMGEGQELPIYHALLSHPDFSPKLLDSDMPKNKLVYRYRTDVSYRANVFYHVEYIHEIWGKYFEILDIVKEGHNYQDVILVRKPY